MHPITRSSASFLNIITMIRIDSIDSRGQMGAPAEITEKAVEQSLPNGNGVKVSEKDDNISNIKDEKENTGGCCQGANGFSCCRDESSEGKEVKKSIFKPYFLTKKWEQHEVFTAAAVVGAVATVAVAYSLYKRSR